MARHRKHYSRGGGFGGKKMLGLGMLAGPILGIGAAIVARRFIGSPLGTWTGPAVGFAVGGPMGAIGAYAYENMLGGSSSTPATVASNATL